MNFESLVEILKYAIEKEKEAAEFYLEISRQEPFAGAKETFEQFAAEERKHQVLLEKFEENREKTCHETGREGLETVQRIADQNPGRGLSQAI
jgi:rubrerythrin